MNLDRNKLPLIDTPSKMLASLFKEEARRAAREESERRQAVALLSVEAWINDLPEVPQEPEKR